MSEPQEHTVLQRHRNVVENLKKEMDDFLFENIFFNLLTSVTLPSCHFSPKFALVIKTRKEESQYAYDILQKCSLCS